MAGVRGRGTSQPGDGAFRAKMHLNWELVPWLGGQVHVPLGWQDILRGDTCEPLCTGPGTGKAGHAGISVDVGCRGQARPPWATWPCRDLSDPSLPDLSPAQGEATDYLPEAPGMSRKEASGRRGLDTTRSEAPALGPRQGGWSLDHRESQGHQDASPGLRRCPVTFRQPWEEHVAPPWGKHAGPVQRRPSWPVWGEQVSCLPGTLTGQPWSCPGWGPSPGRSSPEAPCPGAVLSPR